MASKTHTLHTARINNNCPECYSKDGLEFTFAQEETDTRWYSKASNTVAEVLYCHNCDQQVFPVNWTEDIERVYDYHRKLAKPKSSSLKLKPITYLIILLDAVLIAVLIYYFS